MTSDEKTYHFALQLVALGKITRTQGHAGAVRLLPFFSPAELIEHLKTPEVYVCVESQSDEAAARRLRRLSLASVHYHKQFIILTFKEIRDMTAAESLRGLVLYTLPHNLWSLSEDEFFAYQLVGLRVVSEAPMSTNLGTVISVEDGVVHDFLRVAGPTKEFLIPFVRAMVRRVDFTQGIIEVNLPEGLTEL